MRHKGHMLTDYIFGSRFSTQLMEHMYIIRQVVTNTCLCPQQLRQAPSFSVYAQCAMSINKSPQLPPKLWGASFRG
jgi:hypothetical protein